MNSPNFNCNNGVLAGYSAEQAGTIVKVLTQSLQSAVVPIERSVVSHRHLVSDALSTHCHNVWFMGKELTEVKILRELEKVSSKLILLERTSLDSLKKENDVRFSDVL